MNKERKNGKRLPNEKSKRKVPPRLQRHAETDEPSGDELMDEQQKPSKKKSTDKLKTTFSPKRFQEVKPMQEVQSLSLPMIASTSIKMAQNDSIPCAGIGNLSLNDNLGKTSSNIPFLQADNTSIPTSVAGIANKSSEVDARITVGGAAAPAHSYSTVDMLPEFQPGKPWKGFQQPNAEEDPYVTPGSIARNPFSLNVITLGSLMQSTPSQSTNTTARINNTYIAINASKTTSPMRNKVNNVTQKNLSSSLRTESVFAPFSIANSSPLENRCAPSGMASAPPGNTFALGGITTPPLGNTFAPGGMATTPILGNTFPMSSMTSPPLGNTFAPGGMATSPILGNTFPASSMTSPPLGNPFSSSSMTSPPLGNTFPPGVMVTSPPFQNPFAPGVITTSPPLGNAFVPGVMATSPPLRNTFSPGSMTSPPFGNPLVPGGMATSPPLRNTFYPGSMTSPPFGNPLVPGGMATSPPIGHIFAPGGMATSPPLRSTFVPGHTASSPSSENTFAQCGAMYSPLSVNTYIPPYEVPESINTTPVHSPVSMHHLTRYNAVPPHFNRFPSNAISPGGIGWPAIIPNVFHPTIMPNIAVPFQPHVPNDIRPVLAPPPRNGLSAVRNSTVFNANSYAPGFGAAAAGNNVAIIEDSAKNNMARDAVGAGNNAARDVVGSGCNNSRDAAHELSSTDYNATYESYKSVHAVAGLDYNLWVVPMFRQPEPERSLAEDENMET